MSGRRSPRPTRREALALLGGGLAWALAGCGGEPPPGSTLARSLVDPDGDALLSSGPGMALLDRRDLGGGGRPERALTSMAQLADPHVRDAQSPARAPFLDRLGPRLGSAFRPHELLTAQVLAATVGSVNDWGEAEAVLVSGDLIDSAQRNELDWALAILGGATAVPNSGGSRYQGVQAASNPDPLYYRPDVDAPRHPGLLGRALRPVRSPGLTAPWWPVLGNHDVLGAGRARPHRGDHRRGGGRAPAHEARRRGRAPGRRRAARPRPGRRSSARGCAGREPDGVLRCAPGAPRRR